MSDKVSNVKMTKQERSTVRAAVEDVAYGAGADLSISASDMRRVYATVDRLLAARLTEATRP